jgi:hypothetical protein
MGITVGIHGFALVRRFAYQILFFRAKMSYAPLAWQCHITLTAGLAIQSGPWIAE